MRLFAASQRSDKHTLAARAAVADLLGAPSVMGVVLGPSMFNFAEATRLAVQAGAAIQAPDAAAAIRDAFGLLSDPVRSSAMGRAGKKLCDAHRGATQRHLDACQELLRETQSGSLA